MGHKVKVTKKKAEEYKKDPPFSFREIVRQLGWGGAWSDVLPSKEGYYWLRYKGKGRRRWEGPFVAWVQKCDGKRKDCWFFQFVNKRVGLGLVGECDLMDCQQWAGPLVEPVEEVK